ncbi:hypothetical protein D7Z26_10275 [Cohnella endophytica]|uniref:Uncharacterized protein n=1 Tax=Cohnella endophytica TaxID=2419778 RepID=A0A494XZZ0_9BACL|nr:hypothetical protein [Cohnella endophytica]RKP55559.1 hypothetical protein D7Z26_10275 [Cohnella endophytica]
MFKKLFGKKEKTGSIFVIQLNDKIMPIDRGEYYEDPIDEFLRKNKYGEVIGGGTMQAESGEIVFCNIEFLIYQGNNEEQINMEIIEMLEKLGAPKGSHLSKESTNEQINLGQKEGLGIYLDGTNLPDEVYAECDSNIVLAELSKLVRYDGEVQRYWQGNTETALYFYGDSFKEMNNAILEFTSNYPLCQNARIIQIA